MGAVLYTANTTAQTVAVGGTIAVGSAVRRAGCSCKVSGNNIEISDTGYYQVDVSVTAEPSAIGSTGVQLISNGVEVPGATGSAYAAVADVPVNIAFSAVVRNRCGCIGNTLSLMLEDGASSVTNVGVVVTRL